MSENQIIQELLTKAKQRDIEAAKEILRRISDKMYFITRLYVADHEQARKVEQAGLKKVFSNLKEVTNSEWFECWTAEIVRKEAIAHVLPLKESTTNSNMYTEADEIPNYMAVLPETVEGKKYQVLEMMDKLSTGARAALALHLYDGLSIEESAKLLMTTPQSVMSWLTEAKDTLMSGGFNLGTLIVLMDKLNPVSSRALVLKMQDDLALQSAEDDILSGVFAQSEETVKPVETPSLPQEKSKEVQFPDLPSTSGSDEIEDTLSLPTEKEEPTPISHEQEVRSSATQVLKKDLFDENDEEVEDIEEEESKGGSFFVKFLIVILTLMLLAGLAWIVYDSMGGKFDFKSLFGSKNETTSVVANSDATPEPTATPATPEPTPETLGEVEVVIDSLNIRGGAGTNFDVVGSAKRGEKFTVLSVEQTSDYTWYQIGENKWLADKNNQFLTYRK
ncbi:sigma factor-like helix-turn-helix DNA-binding protein [Solobacterium moorei]|uniref:sigma factor-like helix-turn-helix DNA-binding protein n=1 Tax=Solobacterium moorei TaxID=102148 RepID=UPI0023F1873A|nr:sigma factor-like helix-turn-helix DNA-binding protein [Solobacterium moorei]